MRKNDSIKLGDIYGEMLRNVEVVKESQIKNGGNDLNDKMPLQNGGPQEKSGFHKSLEDAYSSVYDNEEDEEHENECDCEGECHCHEEDNEEIVDDEENDDEEEENITESKKIAKKSLNKIMTRKKSTFDKLFESVIKENFGMPEDNEDLGALGLDDAASDDELGDDFDLGGEEEGDSVTFTLDRATAQTLIDVLQGALGDGDEGDDLDFDDEGGEDDGMDFDEDEETIGAKDAKGGGQQHALQGRNNKVNGRPQPKGGSAQNSVTDKVGNDGDHGHALHGAKKPNDGRQNKVGNLKQGADLF